MAAINFPDAPTNGQIFESGGMSWTYVAGIGWTLNSAIVEAGSGFTFIADTMPLPVNVGDTWFDSSTGASGGTSWVAIEEGPAGASEKVWVQFAPGLGGTPSWTPVFGNATFQGNAALTGNAAIPVNVALSGGYPSGSITPTTTGLKIVTGGIYLCQFSINFNAVTPAAAQYIQFYLDVVRNAGLVGREEYIEQTISPYGHAGGISVWSLDPGDDIRLICISYGPGGILRNGKLVAQKIGMY